MRRALVGLAFFAAVVLGLGAASHGFRSSLHGAPPPVFVDTVAAAGSKLSVGGKTLPTKIEALIVDDELGAVAVVVEITNQGGAAVEVPVAITLLDGTGAGVGNNTDAGIDPTLNHVPSIGAKATELYVNDGLSYDTAPASAKVVAGVGTAAGKLIQLQLTGKVEQSIYGPVVRGVVTNPGGKQVVNVLVEAVIRKDGKIVAAGSARVAVVEPGKKGEYEIPLIGNPAGGKLAVWAPAVP